MCIRDSKKQRRRLRLSDVVEISFSRFSARKPESLQGERRWLPTIERQGRRRTIQGWRRFTSLYEAGHVTHLAGRDADISYVTGGNRSHFAVDIANIDAVATWHWFEALSAAAKATQTEVEKLLLDRTVIQHLKANLPKAALQTELFTQVIRRSGGHNAHHHLRLLAPTSASETNGRAVLEGLAGATLEQLAIDVDYSIPPPTKEATARTPEAAADSNPTPSK